MRLIAVLCALLLGLPSPGARVIVSTPAWKYGHAVWAADGRRLLYLLSSDEWGPVMRLDLANPKQPTPITTEPAGDVVWSPDESRIAYTVNRSEQGRSVNTIYQKSINGQTAVDLLPGALAVHGVSTGKKLHGWFADDVLAFEEHMGTSVQQLFMLDLKKSELFTREKLLASFFIWDEHKQRVAGQTSGGPAQFWLWDRQSRRFLTLPKQLPGVTQWFESWSPDGRSLLFTAWDRIGAYEEPKAESTLYRLDLESGQVTKIADQAGLATWTNDFIAYVQLKPQMTLVVMRANGSVLWTSDLGELAKVRRRLLWGYRPTIAGTFIGYRSAEDEWWVSPVAKQKARLLFKGSAVDANWSPWGRYLAVHRPSDERATLQVIENPLTPGRPVPLETALRVAAEAARRWRPQAELRQGFSQQTYEEQEAVPPPGVNGRRRAWAFDFLDPVSHQFVSIGTWDGQVTGVRASGTDTGRGCDPRQVRVKGEALVKRAKAAGIGPGSGGIAGYGFDIRYEDQLGRCVVSVGGVDGTGKPTGLLVDAETGEPLPAKPPLSEAEIWQDEERGKALPRLIAAAAEHCARPVKPAATVPELERSFIEAVRPLLQATLTGVYGVDLPSWQERVVLVQSMKRYPEVLRAVVEVQTYEGAHNPLGIDAVEFELLPGPHFHVRGVKHRRHPEARSRELGRPQATRSIYARWHGHSRA